MRFVGCYIDKKKRDLPVMAGSGSMSIPKCYRLCRAKRYAYFGVQYSKECWCGNSYGKYGKRSKSECRMKCSGKKSTFCGSSWRNSIYTTGLPARRRPRVSRLPLSRCSQHSVGWNGKCSRAIDGNTNQNYGKKSCTHTRTATGAWWQARTSRRARITSVRIYNRRDCCANRLRNFVIKVDGRVCASYRSSRAFSVRTFRCNAVGRTVRIQTRNRVPLTLCEVQVFGRYAKGRSRSRTPGMRFVGCYIDKKKRDLPVMAGSGSMSIPKCYRLCRAKRYAYFGVQYSKECWCGNSYGKYGKRSKSECRMKCSGKKSTFCGSSWRNSIYTTGLPARRRPRVSRLPLSRCSQHSVGWNGKCSRAIDGNTNQNYGKKSCTHTRTATGAWWQARTSRRARITSVRIYNRRDCCANRLRNFVIKVDGRVCASYRSSRAFSVRTFRCNAVGRTVRIQTRNRVPLTLCEVQVFGRYAKGRSRSRTPGMRFVGCYIDKKKRDLPVMAGSGSMSIPKCYRLCRAKRYAYFGVQYSKECWCGNSYGKYGKRSKSECRMKCSGKKSTFCGSSWRNSIYTTGLPARRRPRVSRLPLSRCSQHSVGWNGKCSRAIDGNTNQNYGKKSCTHTRTATGAWWQARTSRRARITSVRIYNRRDCCANRLRNFVIKVDGRVCASYRSSRAFSVRTFRCNAVGRTVRIQTRNRVPLTLCEVQVFGRYAKGRSRSRTPGMRFVGCYIDKKKRDLPVMAGSGSMSIPKCYRLCRAKRYAYFGVQYSKECWCGNSYGKYGKRSKSECRMKCSGKKSTFCGSSWRNSIYTTGLPARRRPRVSRLPLSRCSQHSVGWNGKCSRAIDGNTNQNYGKKSCTHTRTATGAWWQARTSRRARITSVRIYNRRDCCANRLRNFVIKVDGRVCASYRSSRAFSVRTFRCNAVGRTVRIQTRNRVPLTLCEVQVFGRYVGRTLKPSR
uniref:WSC domain-containing protein n=1 Tax=Macrostomum lignano TaxID=282301 RepID=A0A1I8G3S4_9PLAT